MAINLKRAAQARAIVVRHLSAYIGERALAGSPEYDKARRTWHVPVLCRTPRGVFLAGEIQLDSKLKIVHAPSKEELTRVVEAQLAKIPYLVFAEEGELEAKGFKPIRV